MLAGPAAANAEITSVFSGHRDAGRLRRPVRRRDRRGPLLPREPAQHGRDLRRRPDRRERRLPARARERTRRPVPDGHDVPRLRRLQARPRLDAPLARPGLRHLQHDHARLRRVVWNRRVAGGRRRPAATNGYVRLMDTRYEVRDAQELIGLLVDEGLVDRERIGATGGSYGGGMSMALAALSDRKMLPDGTSSAGRRPEGTAARAGGRGAPDPLDRPRLLAGSERRHSRLRRRRPVLRRPSTGSASRSRAGSSRSTSAASPRLLRARRGRPGRRPPRLAQRPARRRAALRRRPEVRDDRRGDLHAPLLVLHRRFGRARRRS